MSDKAVKAAVERFVENVSYSAQRELEKVMRKAMANGKVKNGDVLTTAVTLSNAAIDLDVTIFSKIKL